MKSRNVLVAVLAATFGVASSTAQSEDRPFSGITAGTLANLCRTHRPLTFDSCGAYIIGVSDEISWARRTCRPVNSESGNLQVEAVVTKYLKDNPERWDRPAMVEVDRALKLAFPCPRPVGKSEKAG